MSPKALSSQTKSYNWFATVVGATRISSIDGGFCDFDERMISSAFWREFCNICVLEVRELERLVRASISACMDWSAVSIALFWDAREGMVVIERLVF